MIFNEGGRVACSPLFMKRLTIFIFTFLAFFIFASQSFASTTNYTPTAGQNQILYTNLTGTTGSLRFGAASLGSWTDKIGLKYTPTVSHYLCSIDVFISKTGAPTDSVNLKLYQGGSGLDNGTLLATSANVWLGSDFSTSPQRTTFWFGTNALPATCQGIVKNQTYWFTFARTGTPDDSHLYNFYFIQQTNTELVGWTKQFGAVGSPTNYGYADLYGISDGSALDIVTTVTNPCSGSFLESTCNLLSSLFIPSTSFASASADTLKTTFLSKAPFSYINSALNLDLSTTGSGSSSPTLTLQINKPNSYVSSILPVSMTWTDSSANNNAFIATSAIRGVFTILLWLAFVFYIIFTIRRVF